MSGKVSSLLKPKPWPITTPAHPPAGGQVFGTQSRAAMWTGLVAPGEQITTSSSWKPKRCSCALKSGFAGAMRLVSTHALGIIAPRAPTGTTAAASRSNARRRVLTPARFGTKRRSSFRDVVEEDEAGRLCPVMRRRFHADAELY